MKNLPKLSKRHLISLILLLACASFMAGLASVIAFQSKSFLAAKIETAIIESEKLSTLDKSMTFERALKLYSSNLSFAVFRLDCTPIYVTNLLINPSVCLEKNDIFVWKEFSTPSQKSLVLGFYNNFTFASFWKEYQLILITTIITYLGFVFFITFSFFSVFLDNPIKKITATIDDLLSTKHFDIQSFKGRSGHILSNLYSAVSRLLEEVVRFNREEEKLILSKQIAHDLQAPLSVLEGIYRTGVDEGSIEKMALKRLRDITNGLISNPKHESSSKIQIESLISELQTLYPEITIKSTCHESVKRSLSLTLTEVELFRFLSNIIKNSIEAKAKTILLDSFIGSSFFEISLKDDGLGVSQNDVSKIILGHTSKAHGHGMGVSAINKKLNEIGGSLEIETSIDSGFKLSLKIPMSEQSTVSHYVLIDNDKLIRINWSSRAKKEGIDLKCFSSVSLFLEATDEIPFESHIYIDSDLDDNVRGEVEAALIAKKGYKNLYLATGYAQSDFDLNSFPWIKGIISKSPPF